MVIVPFYGDSDYGAAGILRAFVLLIGAEKWANWWEWLYEFSNLEKYIKDGVNKVYYEVNGDMISKHDFDDNPTICGKLYEIEFDYVSNTAMVKEFISGENNMCPHCRCPI